VTLFNRADRADDAALVAGLALGDHEASTAFVRRFQDRVYGLAVAITRDPVTAQDVSQEVFVRAWRSAGSFDRRRGSVLTWLLAITRNAAIDVIRARSPIPTDGEHLDRILEGALSDERSVERTAEHAEERARAVAGLRELPEEQARAVVLAVIGGCTAREVSEREGIPLGTAKTRIRSGLRRLRTDLEEELHD